METYVEMDSPNISENPTEFTPRNYGLTTDFSDLEPMSTLDSEIVMDLATDTPDDITQGRNTPMQTQITMSDLIKNSVEIQPNDHVNGVEDDAIITLAHYTDSFIKRQTEGLKEVFRDLRITPLTKYDRLKNAAIAFVNTIAQIGDENAAEALVSFTNTLKFPEDMRQVAHCSKRASEVRHSSGYVTRLTKDGYPTTLETMVWASTDEPISHLEGCPKIRKKLTERFTHGKALVYVWFEGDEPVVRVEPSDSLRDVVWENVHHAEHAYVCVLCLVKLSNKSSQERHAKGKHIEQLYSCSACGAVNLELPDWEYHKKTCISLKRSRGRPKCIPYTDRFSMLPIEERIHLGIDAITNAIHCLINEKWNISDTEVLKTAFGGENNTLASPFLPVLSDDESSSEINEEIELTSSALEKMNFRKEFWTTVAFDKWTYTDRFVWTNVSETDKKVLTQMRASKHYLPLYPKESPGLIGNDLESFNVGEDLSEKIVKGYLYLLRKRIEERPSLPRSYIFDVNFLTSYLKDFEGASDNTPPESFFYEFQFFPIRRDKRWFLILVDRDEHSISYLDPAGSHYKSYLSVVCSYMEQKQKEILGKIDHSKYSLVTIDGLPTHGITSSNSGIYMLQYITALTQKLDIKLTNNQCKKYWERMHFEILRGKLYESYYRQTRFRESN